MTWQKTCNIVCTQSYTDDFARGEEPVKGVYFDEVSTLSLMQPILRQRVDVLLDQRGPLQSGGARFRRQGAVELRRGGQPRMQGSRWEAGGSGGQQGPRSDRRRPRQEAAHGERAGPRTMTDHAATTWVVRLTTHCARGRGGCVPKRDRNDPIRYEQNALAFLFARSAGRSRSPINRIQICELVVF